MLFFKNFHIIRNSITMLHCFENYFTIKFVPVGCDYRCIFVLFTQKSNSCDKFFFAYTCSSAKHDTLCVFNLVVVKLTEVFHIHFALCCIGNGSEAVKLNIFVINILNSLYNITQFTYTGRFDYYAIWGIFRKHFFECFAEISHKRTADTS